MYFVNYTYYANLTIGVPHQNREFELSWIVPHNHITTTHLNFSQTHKVDHICIEDFFLICTNWCSYMCNCKSRGIWGLCLRGTWGLLCLRIIWGLFFNDLLVLFYFILFYLIMYLFIYFGEFVKNPIASKQHIWPWPAGIKIYFAYNVFCLLACFIYGIGH